MTFTTYANRDYLQKVTAFLSECRSRDPAGGIWDVGDLHWWWRDDLYGNAEMQRFWEDDGETLGVLLLAEDYATFDYEFLPGLEESDGAQALLREGIGWLEDLKQRRQEAAPSFYVRTGHHRLRSLAGASGFKASGEAYVQTVQRLTQALPAVELPEGFSVRPLDECDFTEGKPPVLELSAPRFRRVTETPSYRRELHLVVTSPGGQVAAECICWWDRVNAIGVFEPVAVAEAFRRRGLGKALLFSGLHQFAVRGVKLAKVTHAKSSVAATRLYASSGFRWAFDRDIFVQSESDGV